MVRHAAAGAGTERIFAPDVLPLRESGDGVKAASGKHCLTVETRLWIFERIHFDHAPHLSAIFRRKAGRINTHRLHVVRFNLRSEARRAIVRQRNAIHHKLCLILRAARMQDGIALV